MSHLIIRADEESNFKYDPNKNAALAAAALFGISSIWHLWVMIKSKTWVYTALVVGAFMMTIGYIARYLAAKSPFSSGPYILQSLFLILPPSLYAATIYMIYGRIVLLVNAPQASLIRPTWVTKIFVTGDVISFLMQAGGGGLTASSNPDTARLGQNILMVGLVLQLIFFGIFLTISLIFFRRVRSTPSYLTTSTPVKHNKHSWQTLLKFLFVSAALIIFRCVFRIIEFAQGDDGYLMKKEVFIYVFDAAPMLIVQVAMSVVHAKDVFPKKGDAGSGLETETETVTGKISSRRGGKVEKGWRGQ
ncbi:putative RTA1 domain protein [Cadophora sp. DSE1049]|nr:putative RTA1 domain protein [Cadophora sp. DSE1049]